MELTEMMQACPFDGKFISFVDGKYHIRGFARGNVVKHPWTLTQKLLPHIFAGESVHPIANIKRKIILYPEPSSLDDQNYFLPIYIYNPAVYKEANVPPFPEDGDTVKVMGVRNETWYCKVCEVDLEAQSLKVQWYQETRRQGVWTLLHNADTIHFGSLIGFVQTRRVFGGIRFGQSN